MMILKKEIVRGRHRRQHRCPARAGGNLALIVLVGFVTGVGTLAFSQLPDDGAQVGNRQESVQFEENIHTCVLEEEGFVVCTAKLEFPLYRNPPEAIPFLSFFLLPPEQSGTVPVGKRFRIQRSQTVDLIGERSRWLSISPYGGDSSFSNGWTYAGSDAAIAHESGSEPTKR